MAADEKIGEADILPRLLSVRNCQGTQRAGSARANFVMFAFYSPSEYPSPSCHCQVDSPRIINPHHQPDLQL
jgi:hypothetical protein